MRILRFDQVSFFEKKKIVGVNEMLNTHTGYNAQRCSQNRTLSVP
jgi:hypothetical protein